MDSILGDLRRRHSRSLAKSCSENNCKLIVGSRKTHVIFKGEKMGDGTRRMCDCIIFRNDKKIILVEIKSTGNIDMDEIIQQFTNAGTRSLEITKPYRDKFEIFCLLLLRGQVRNHTKRLMLRYSRVRIANNELGINQARCKSRLDSLI
ncbi:MAG: hypothetical protein MPJ04_08900 [Nitrosopumilus sp.]|nr:hypothetical protein [Nitrosopumilus sp.]MDA8004907.1 hypothetical protein [Alphaproteobacteria bacterium]